MQSSQEADEFVRMLDQVIKYGDDRRKYVDSLEDGTRINFYRLPEDNEKDEYMKEYMSPTDESSNDEEIIMIDDKIYVNKVNITMLDDPNMADKILDANKIVYPFSSMNVAINHPLMDKLTFQVDNENNREFTMYHLVTMVLRYFRFVYRAHLHFDLKSGEWKDEKLVDNKLFHPCLADYQYDVNVTGLRFCQKTKSWEVGLDWYV